MRAVLRLGMAIAAAGLWLGQPALAQSAPAPTTNTPASNSIGPRELQNFSLEGNVTRPAEPRPATQAPAATAPAARTPPAASEQGAPRPLRTVRAEPRPGRSPPAAATGSVQPAATLPGPEAAAPPSPAPDIVPEPVSTDEPANLAPERTLPVWPWLLAALALGAGGAFLLWRRNSRHAFAGGPELDAFVAPEAERGPAPPPAAAPEPSPRPKGIGIVSTRMRPWIEVGCQPLQCLGEDERVTFEFELELFNSGSAPAREVLAEVNLFNAGPTQDEDIGRFFARPIGQGERIPAIPPMQRVSLRPQVTVSRDQLRILEAGGRQVFVPLIAFNALYRWGGGEGQTSVAYLLGRDTKGEKLAPFRVDLGVRLFPKVGARPLPMGLRN